MDTLLRKILTWLSKRKTLIRNILLCIVLLVIAALTTWISYRYHAIKAKIAQYELGIEQMKQAEYEAKLQVEMQERVEIYKVIAELIKRDNALIEEMKVKEKRLETRLYNLNAIRTWDELHKFERTRP